MKELINAIGSEIEVIKVALEFAKKKKKAAKNLRKHNTVTY